MAKVSSKTPKKTEPKTDSQIVMQAWVKAVNEFSTRKQQLDSVMDAYEATVTNGPYELNPSVTVALSTLVGELTAMMETLLRQTEDLERQGEPPLSILAIHARTLRYWSKKIKQALSEQAIGAS